MTDRQTTRPEQQKAKVKAATEKDASLLELQAAELEQRSLRFASPERLPTDLPPPSPNLVEGAARFQTSTTSSSRRSRPSAARFTRPRWTPTSEAAHASASSSPAGWVVVSPMMAMPAVRAA
jgi:hypothetical protein